MATMEPGTITFALKATLAASERLGLFESAVSRQLDRMHGDLRQLVAAPLHEGLRRISYAANADRRDQLQLLHEARGKFDDAAARDLSPLQHGWAVLLGACTWWMLDSPDLARRAGREALIAAELSWSEAEARTLRYHMGGSLFRGPDPEPELNASEVLAVAAVQVNLVLGFPFAPEMRAGDIKPYYYFSSGGVGDCLVHIDPDFVRSHSSPA